MSFQVFFIFAALVFGVFADTPYTTCTTQLNGATINHFQVNDCTTSPCQVKRGSTITLSLDIAARVNIGLNTQPSVTVAVIISGTPFPVYQSTLCSITTCPILAGTTRVIVASQTLPSTATPGTYTVRLSVVDNSQTILCAQFVLSVTL
ncbi:hypothetical protein PPYR_15223 [Photinus pyralis]|uniref:MD-2-related lipid-recognition domain-containing protein n=1 Tax=Photinus pyralis TaxID=7054 RepID=A0A5N3ZZF5_PHOPY|nr:uncharacterized protein LOC116182152 [Photinus pyralis]KAB0790408.1 hypothetical protein PPYR_15223 [Photinus pyralis]